jgi:hypothetical protein
VISTNDVKPTNQKVYFIRVGEEEYKRITEIAQSEERSINKMANLLLRAALESRK